MSNLLLSLLYLSLFFVISLMGYQLYKVLNKRIKQAKTALAMAGFALLLFAVFALLLIGGLYLFIELYAFLASPRL